MNDKKLKELLQHISEISDCLIDNLNELNNEEYIDLEELVNLLSDIEMDLKDTHQLVDKAYDKANELQDQKEIESYGK